MKIRIYFLSLIIQVAIYIIAMFYYPGIFNVLVIIPICFFAGLITVLFKQLFRTSVQEIGRGLLLASLTSLGLIFIFMIFLASFVEC
jgi:hypothetical protein